MSKRTDLLSIADDELILGWRNPRPIAPPRGGRGVLVDRAERDRPRPGALRARRCRASDDGGRAGIRPQAGGVPLGTARRASPPGMGAHDRAPLALRDGGRDPTRCVEGIRRPGDRRNRRKDGSRGGAYHRMHAEMWIDRLLSTQDGRSRSRTRQSTSSGPAPSVCSTASSGPSSAAEPRSGLGRDLPDVEPVPRGVHEAELAELLEEMTMVRRSAPPGTQWCNRRRCSWHLPRSQTRRSP